MARKVEKASTECLQKGKHFHEAKTSLAKPKTLYRAKTQMRNRVDRANTRFPNENVFSERKRRSKSLRRFYLAKMSLAQAKTRLPKNALTERHFRWVKAFSTVFRAKAWLPKAEARLPRSCIPQERRKRLPSENVPRKCGNASYREKTTQTKAKKSLPRENAFTERKRVPRAKTWLAKFQTRLSSENVPRKGDEIFFERKRRSQRRKQFCLEKIITS